MPFDTTLSGASYHSGGNEDLPLETPCPPSPLHPRHESVTPIVGKRIMSRNLKGLEPYRPNNSIHGLGT